MNLITIVYHDYDTSDSDKLFAHIATCDGRQQHCFRSMFDQAAAQRKLNKYIESDDTQADEYAFILDSKVGDTLSDYRTHITMQKLSEVGR